MMPRRPLGCPLLGGSDGHQAAHTLSWRAPCRWPDPHQTSASWPGRVSERCPPTGRPVPSQPPAHCQRQKTAQSAATQQLGECKVWWLAPAGTLPVRGLLWAGAGLGVRRALSRLQRHVQGWKLLSAELRQPVWAGLLQLVWTRQLRPTRAGQPQPVWAGLLQPVWAGQLHPAWAGLLQLVWAGQLHPVWARLL